MPHAHRARLGRAPRSDLGQRPTSSRTLARIELGEAELRKAPITPDGRASPWLAIMGTAMQLAAMLATKLRLTPRSRTRDKPAHELRKHVSLTDRLRMGRHL
jgi:hypothetical protein